MRIVLHVWTQTSKLLWYSQYTDWRVKNIVHWCPTVPANIAYGKLKAKRRSHELKPWNRSLSINFFRRKRLFVFIRVNFSCFCSSLKEVNSLPISSCIKNKKGSLLNLPYNIYGSLSHNDQVFTILTFLHVFHALGSHNIHLGFCFV